MPREMLYSEQMEKIAEQHFKSHIDWERKKLTGIGLLEQEIFYYYNPEQNAVIIPAPLAVKDMMASAYYQPNYEIVVQAIKNDLKQDDFMISGSLIGKGTGECHYVAFHKDTQGQMAIFDSTFSGMDRFLSSSDKPSFWEKLIGYLQAPFRFIAFSLGFGRKIETQFLDQTINVYRLGTQAALDSVSCGYYSMGAVLSMSEAISQNNGSLETIEQVIKESKDLDLKAEELFLTNDTPSNDIPAVHPAFSRMPKDELISLAPSIDIDKRAENQAELPNLDPAIESEPDSKSPSMR